MGEAQRAWLRDPRRSCQWPGRAVPGVDEEQASRCMESGYNAGLTQYSINHLVSWQVLTATKYLVTEDR